MCRVVLEHVDHVIQRDEGVVDGDNLYHIRTCNISVKALRNRTECNVQLVFSLTRLVQIGFYMTNRLIAYFNCTHIATGFLELELETVQRFFSTQIGIL